MPKSEDDASVAIVACPSPVRLGAALEEILSAPAAGAAHRREALLTGVKTTIVRGRAVECAPRCGLGGRSGRTDRDQEGQTSNQLLHTRLLRERAQQPYSEYGSSRPPLREVFR